MAHKGHMIKTGGKKRRSKKGRGKRRGGKRGRGKK
jgi:hypothetical protein